jgi:uncharacterized protein (DUF3820 family)
MPFGKFKGEPLEDLPTSYIEWLLGECNLERRLEQELQNQLEMREGRGVARKGEQR